ncbi:MAG: hypothetical protein R6W71_09540 [Bacteroidales bacterium]
MMEKSAFKNLEALIGEAEELSKRSTALRRKRIAWNLKNEIF